jgi:penicillin-binding protein 1A
MSRFLRRLLKILRFGFAALFAATTAGAILLGAAYLYLAPKLPSIENLKDVQLQVPLRVFTADHKLIAEFGEKRRTPVKYQDVPDRMIKAFLAAEDDRFFQHPGVDYQGILRAVIHLIKTGQKGQGGSTITMQVARNFFLSREKTFTRKLNEIFLALKIERELTKEEILELYLNKIYLGNRAYGVQAAAHVYYGVGIDQLTLAQTAMIAGLPKAPSRFNPIINPSRALERRGYVLGRMHALGFITDSQYKSAMQEPVSATLHALNVEVPAPYVAEMVRADMVQRYGTDAYTAGYQVYTTLNAAHQREANQALRDALLAYDQRHGYRGAEKHIDLAQQPDQDSWNKLLSDLPVVGGLLPGLVTKVEDKSITVYLGKDGSIQIGWDGLHWARRYIDDNHRGPTPKKAGDILKPGDVVRVQRIGDAKWRLAQIPQVSGALVSLNPRDGAIEALVGGFDYYQSKFNRVTQARRQPGSSFKPFIYSAALNKGFTAASLINDAPVVFNDPALESTWRPENYSGRFFGPTRLREALVHSRNLVSIRLLQSIGVSYAIKYASRFGFPAGELPRNLSLALGSASVTPLQLATGYAVFANGGYRVKPYYIRRILNEDGAVLFRSDPAVACPHCDQKSAGGTQANKTAPAADAANAQPEAPAAPAAGSTSADDGNEDSVPAGTATDVPPTHLAPRIITPQNDYLMISMMRDVIRHGTGRAAMRLGRHDLAGKTGTTNDQRDAWFSGFNSDLVATVWVGFDQVHPLGRHETGARAALPAWISYMGAALRGVPEKPLDQPPGLVTVRIDPVTGLLASNTTPNAIFETFRTAHVPKQVAQSKPAAGSDRQGGTSGIPQQIF